VAVRPQKARVIHTLLTGSVPSAVWRLISRCGLAVLGQRVRRWSSQSSGA
jgi:hypothetical protein